MEAQVGEAPIRLGVEANQKGRDIEREEPASTFCEGVNDMVRVEAAPLDWDELTHPQPESEEL